MGSQDSRTALGSLELLRTVWVVPELGVEFLKKNLNACRPSEHPPVRGTLFEGISKITAVSLYTRTGESCFVFFLFVFCLMMLSGALSMFLSYFSVQQTTYLLWASDLDLEYY